MTLWPEKFLAVDAVYGDIPGPDHDAVSLLAGEVSPPTHHPSMFTCHHNLLSTNIHPPCPSLTKRPLELQTNPNAWSKVSVTHVLDSGHLLVVDAHNVLPNLQVLLVHLLLELVVVTDGAGLEGWLGPGSTLSDRGAPADVNLINREQQPVLLTVKVLM